MSLLNGETIFGIHIIRMSDICGLWEVIRISRENFANPLYPWVKDRFKYSFQPEMNFLCLQNGQKFPRLKEITIMPKSINCVEVISFPSKS